MGKKKDSEVEQETTEEVQQETADAQPEEVQQETTDAQPEEVLYVPSAHEHVFRRGILPGQKYIRNCIVPSCGLTEQITYTEWMRTL